MLDNDEHWIKQIQMTNKIKRLAFLHLKFFWGDMEGWKFEMSRYLRCMIHFGSYFDKENFNAYIGDTRWPKPLIAEIFSSTWSRYAYLIIFHSW